MAAVDAASKGGGWTGGTWFLSGACCIANMMFMLLGSGHDRVVRTISVAWAITIASSWAFLVSRLP